jgi:hypothetical protein
VAGNCADIKQSTLFYPWNNKQKIVKQNETLADFPTNESRYPKSLAHHGFPAGATCIDQLETLSQ